MHVLLHLRNAAYLRHFLPFIDELLGRGHRLTVVFQLELERERETAERLAARPGVQIAYAVRREGRTRRTALRARGALDYLRYFEPGFERAAFLRRRQSAEAPRPLVRAGERGLLGPRAGVRRALARAARAVDLALPAPPEVVEQLRGLDPDLVVVSPLVADTDQADVVRAARALGLPCTLLVASWDNLTNKGLVRDVPDDVVLWNEAQRREARDLHGIPEERILVTGAHTFDPWFDLRPSEPREAFCERLGFDPERPIVLYLCSSIAIARTEPSWVVRWVQALREAGDPLLAGANVLVRPHPASGVAWRTAPPPPGPRVAIWPPVGDSPTDAQSRAGFFDSMHHAVAVVGINTSAIIEAAIVGRPGFTVLLEEFAAGQSETLHFDHLREERGGPLRVAGSVEEHLAQLSAALHDDPGPALERFVRSFARPHGLDVAGAPLVVDSLERRAAAGRRDDAVRRRLGAPAALAIPVVEAAGVVRGIQDELRRRRRRRDKRRAAGKPAYPRLSRLRRPFG